MEFNKNLKIWLILSIFSILILLFWTNQSMEIIPFLVKNDVCFQKTMNDNSEEILDELYRQVEAYPQYRAYFDESEIVDSIIQESLNNVRTTDLKEQRQVILDSVLNRFNKYHKEDIASLAVNIYGYSNDELAQKQVQNWALNLTKSTFLQRNRIALLNFYAEKASGTCCFCFSFPEPIFFNQSISTLVNEKSKLQFGISENKKLKYVQLWINNEAYKVIDGKTNYKAQTTKTGWHDLKIKYQGDYDNRILTDSLTYRYYVCD